MTIRQGAAQLIQPAAIQAVHYGFDLSIKAFNHPAFPNWNGKTGAFFCLADMFGNPLVISRLGDIPEENRDQYFQLCQEKARRLASHSNHLSSYQSRNPELNQWGGAIRSAYDLIFSMSGLPELGDEAVMLFAARQMKFINHWNINTIAQISDNTVWERLSITYGVLA